MDVEKSVQVTEFILFGKTIFKINRKTEVNFKENVTPIEPVIELDLTQNN